jgi:limonene-1,2-epoxide hydrolase
MDEASNVIAPGTAVHPSWCAPLFAAIDARDAGAFVSFLTDDALFRFGNAPVLEGSAAIRAAVAGFFAAIHACRHELHATWQGPHSFVCEGVVTYTRLDRRLVALPFVNVFELQDEKISSYRIYIDNAPLFAPAEPGAAPIP